jgi:rhodanese-related sulfurtransferase
LTAHSADDLLASARAKIRRVEPDELDALAAAGALVVDIRPAAQRAAEGELGFGLIVERNVLEVDGYDQPVVVVCSEGYASSLAAASLRELGFTGAGDLNGGYVAWRRWRDAEADDTPDDPGVTR